VLEERGAPPLFLDELNRLGASRAFPSPMKEPSNGHAHHF